MRNWLINTESYSLQKYEGREVLAHPGVHEAAISKISALVAPGSRALELGAGDGSFTRRLLECQLAVTSVDLNPRPEVDDARLTWVQLDLNERFSESFRGTTFDVVCAVEVIEHLENPWEFLREARRCVERGSVLILTTPNVTSFVSRLEFVRSGRLHQFADADRLYGHINPVAFDELSLICERTGWEAFRLEPAGYLPILEFERVTAKAVAWNAARVASWLLSRGGIRRGWVVLLAARAT